jgi:hypothetical protein
MIRFTKYSCTDLQTFQHFKRFCLLVCVFTEVRLNELKRVAELIHVLFGAQ